MNAPNDRNYTPTLDAMLALDARDMCDIYATGRIGIEAVQGEQPGDREGGGGPSVRLIG
jgi:hypothetical protein